MLSQKIAEFEVEFQHLKEENEELRKLLEVEPPKPMDCQVCEFYIQHYVKVSGGYMKTNAGHCVHGKFKDKKPGNKTCQYFRRQIKN